MYFSVIYTIYFLDSIFHFLYLFKMWEIFMPHPVFRLLSLRLLKFHVILTVIFLWIATGHSALFIVRHKSVNILIP